MNEKDRKKIMRAGFVLFRCSEAEKVIKTRNIHDASWHFMHRCQTKKEVKEIHLALLDNPKAIQD